MDVGHVSKDSHKLPVATRIMPRASPTFFSVRRAEGKEKNTKAVDDAADKVENNIAWWPIDGDEAEMIEYRTVIRVSSRPATRVSEASSGVLINDEVGFGNDALATEPFALPDLVFRNQPVVGNGGG